ncbi:unnamed protein product, partial [Nesidiocoris tenuis]
MEVLRVIHAPWSEFPLQNSKLETIKIERINLRSAFLHLQVRFPTSRHASLAGQ